MLSTSQQARARLVEQMADGMPDLDGPPPHRNWVRAGVSMPTYVMLGQYLQGAFEALSLGHRMLKRTLKGRKQDLGEVLQVADIAEQVAWMLRRYVWQLTEDE